MPCSSQIISEMTPHYLLPKQLWNYKLVCLVPLQDVNLVASLRHQYDNIVVMVTYLWRHWYRSMADSVFHAQPNFQWHWKSFNRNFKISQIIFHKLLIQFYKQKKHVKALLFELGNYKSQTKQLKISFYIFFFYKYMVIYSIFLGQSNSTDWNKIEKNIIFM